MCLHFQIMDYWVLGNEEGEEITTLRTPSDKKKVSES